MALYELNGIAPTVSPTAWIAESAQVIGNVHIADGVSIWPGVVIRGDMDVPITIGKNSNIQDNSVLHADDGVPLTIGEGVTVGHLVMLHGCTIGDHSLIGIGAIVLNNARIGKHCLVGASSLVTEGKEFADGSMIIGSPAKAVKELSPEQQEKLKWSAAHYTANAKRFATGLKRVDG
jgi:carbonic anhydrase/acetyltransferase-like protein (isoleucine patch superfamily)